jgi:hypothetical protein
VHVHGTRIGGALALSSGSSTSSFQVVQAAPLSNTFGAQSTLVILVNFQDNPVQPYTAASVQDVVFNQTSGFWMENSFQQTWLTGDVAGWYTLSLSSTSCNVDTIASSAEQAAQSSGYVLANYNHFLIAFPSTTACAWWGYSYIGGTPSTSWVNGEIQIKVVSHELGHALGLYHSHSLDCGTVVYAASGCTLNEYGDSFDTMGNSSPMDYTASQKERLGWLNYSAQPPITTVTTSGTYTLSPYEVQDSNPKALKILQSGTTGTYYYLESRQAIGYDASYDYYVKNGLLLHIAAPSDSNSSDLLNTTPGGPWYAPALAVGQSYTDATAGVTISPTAISSTGATVQVTMAGATCTHANPSLSMTPTQSSWVVSGTTESFTATLTNNDNSACSSSSFNLAAAGLPSGWSSSFGSSALSLAPGASGSTTVQVTSPSGTANGFYSFTATAASGSYSASASSTYVVSAPVSLTMSVSTDKSSYSANQTVTITATVLSGASPDAGASVSVSITSPKGSVTSLSGTTGSNGTAVFSYALRKKATTGTYNVQASTTATGASSSTAASTTFSVQ